MAHLSSVQEELNGNNGTDTYSESNNDQNDYGDANLTTTGGAGGVNETMLERRRKIKNNVGKNEEGIQSQSPRNKYFNNSNNNIGAGEGGGGPSTSYGIAGNSITSQFSETFGSRNIQ